ncbi:Type IV fimbrial biogenesis protein PilY1, partial [hydrothermal vent metagenome]
MQQTQYKLTPVGLLIGLAFSLLSGGASAGTLNLSNSPLFLANQVKPNVMVMLDNSGSMKIAMYNPSWGVRTGFNPATVYSGIFDENKSYIYDSSIPVNTGAYKVTIKSDVQGAFVESACTPSAGDNSCWSGQYLNWLTTRRIDASRVVLIGGKLESRAPFNYGSGLSYKLMANNERSDNSFGGKYSASDSYSPIPNNEAVLVISPADSGAVKAAGYDPYAKISSGVGGGFIYSDAGTKIGEFGQVTTDENWATVNLQNIYTNPVVIAKPPTISGSDPSVVRIKSVVNTSFQVQIQEYKYLDGGHADENITYIVIESGSHTLDGGVKLIADTLVTNSTNVTGNCGSSQTGHADVNFSSAFPSTPVVVSSVMTKNGADPVNSRAWNINANGFDIAMQEEEDEGAHDVTETLGYIAIEAGVVDDTSNRFILEAGTQNNVDENTDTINFTTTFSSAPVFVGALQSMNDGDTAVLRLDSINTSSAQLHVQEEKSCDNEVNHSNEQVGYLALQGASLNLNIALAVGDEPTGLLQDVNS